MIILVHGLGTFLVKNSIKNENLYVVIMERSKTILELS